MIACRENFRVSHRWERDLLILVNLGSFFSFSLRIGIRKAEAS